MNDGRVLTREECCDLADISHQGSEAGNGKLTPGILPSQTPQHIDYYAPTPTPPDDVQLADDLVDASVLVEDGDPVSHAPAAAAHYGGLAKEQLPAWVGEGRRVQS